MLSFVIIPALSSFMARITENPVVTPLVQHQTLKTGFGLSRLYVKDESAQPNGTWKDRRSQMIIEQTRGQAVDTLALITSGNAGYSLARTAQESGKRVVAIVDQDLPEAIDRHLRRACADVIGVDLSHQIFGSNDIIHLAQQGDPDRQVLDVTNGYHQAYESVIDELHDQLSGDQPKYIFCPVGSGEAFVGLYHGLKRLGWSTKLVGVSPMQRPSFADKLHALWTPYQAHFGAMMNEGHRIILLDEGEIRAAYLTMRDVMPSEPSSSAVYGALRKVSIPPKDLVVMINSGCAKIPQST